MADYSILSFEQWLRVQPGIIDEKRARKQYDQYVAHQKAAKKKQDAQNAQAAELKQQSLAAKKNPTPQTTTTTSTTPGAVSPELSSLAASQGIDINALLQGAAGGDSIYVGTHVITQKSRSRDPDIAGHNIQIEDRRPKQSVYDDYLKWSEAERNQFIARAIKLGILNKDSGYIEGEKLWNQLVDEAGNYQRANPNARVGPMDLLTLIGKSINGGSGVSGPAGPVLDQTIHSSSVNLSDRTAVERDAKSVLQAALGRNPSPAELARYQAAINANERANPNTTVQHVHRNADGSQTTQTSTTQGGVSDPTQLILDQVQATPEYGSVQAATTYYNALEQAMQAAV